MNRYPLYIRVFVITLAVMQSFAGWHLLCGAHVHVHTAAEMNSFQSGGFGAELRHFHPIPHSGQHFEHADGIPHHFSEEPFLAVVCCFDNVPCEHSHGCCENSRENAAVLCSEGKCVRSCEPVFAAASPMSAEPGLRQHCFHSAVSMRFAAQKVRLHLLYGSMLI